MLIRLTWDLPAEAAHVALCRRTARMLLEHSDIAEEDIDGIELIVGELCANVIRHAYDIHGGRYSVEVAIDGVELCLSVADSGRGFDSSELSEERQFSETGGMGFYLMSQFAGRIDFRMANGGGSAIVANRTLRRRSAAKGAPAPDEAAQHEETSQHPDGDGA
jgi:anti-sigma regulatory factor (Ser/Thr protein kinase)